MKDIIKTYQVKCKRCRSQLKVSFAYDKAKKKYVPFSIVPPIHCHIEKEKDLSTNRQETDSR